MKWRHWAVLIILVLLNYIIFSTAFTQLARQRLPTPRDTRTPQPTFESLPPSPVAWIVAPTSTPLPTRTPITPAPTVALSLTAEITSTVQPTVTVEPPTATVEPTATPLPPTATPQAASETVIHVVRRGETLSEIAAQYDVSVQAIVDANRLEDPSHIVTGQKLIIPLVGSAPPTEASPTAGAPTATKPKPSNTPKPQTPTPTTKPASLQFTGEVIWDPAVAPNCSGPAISKQSLIRDAASNPVDGVVVEVNCYGNKWRSHPSGNPGEYEAGHYDFVFGQTTPQDWACTARVVEINGQAVTSSQVVTIHFDTNDCQPHGSGHQVAIVNWTKNW